MTGLAALSRRLAAPLTCAAAFLLSAVPATALAQNVTQYFELDGNTALSTSPPAASVDDWNTINTGGASRLALPNKLVSRAFITDPAPATIFTTGGSKDGNNISSWRHKSGSVPDKDDIRNAYAAAYNIGGDLVIYAGADRFDNSGDAFMGFWFFKQNVQAIPGGTFSGLHTAGDILLLANFSGGGTTVSIEVLQWTAAGALQQIANIPSAACGSSGSPLVCGITNQQAGETPTWTHLNKDGGASFQQAGFLEVGINITKLLLDAGVQTGTCFSSFMAETRSSTSLTATLKDFALGSFEVCGIEVTKVCPSGQVGANGASIDYAFNGKVTNTGFGAVTNVTLNDVPQAADPPATVSNAYVFTNCADPAALPSNGNVYAGPLAAGASVCYSSTFNTTNNPSTNKMTATAATSATGTTSAESVNAVCPPLVFPTGLTVTKMCEAKLVATGSAVQVQVDFFGTVCNQGTLGLSSLTAFDRVTGLSDANLVLMTQTANPVPTTTLGAMGTPTECANYRASYVPVLTDGISPFPFSDTVFARGVPPPITQVAEVTNGVLGTMATCNLCLGGTCRTSDGTILNSVLRSSTKK